MRFCTTLLRTPRYAHACRTLVSDLLFRCDWSIRDGAELNGSVYYFISSCLLTDETVGHACGLFTVITFSYIYNYAWLINNFLGGCLRPPTETCCRVVCQIHEVMSSHPNCKLPPYIFTHHNLHSIPVTSSCFHAHICCKELAFSICAPKLWNNFPVIIRYSPKTSNIN